MNRLTLFLSVLALAALTTAPSLADTYTYTYTGNDFINVGSPYTTSDFVSGSFTVSAPLAPNLPYQQISVDSATFTDGVQTLDLATVDSYSFIYIATGSSGDITSWRIALQDTGGTSIATENFGSNSPSDEGSDFNNGLAGVGYNTDAPGAWTKTVNASPADTPEPSSLFLFGTASLVSAGALRRKLFC